ncbi:polysaccharide pyruvyl transferase family protein [Vibrio alginolyticus]|uniref:polysaccharide pyruvyl transferase family protein n=1 Tax=Vibrio alginolyticus TaxID=663 RepID=UPI003D7E4C7E
MNKKIAIATFHKAHNYGAVLQAHALKKFLTNQNYKVKFYDYSPKWIENNYSLFPKFQGENFFGSLKRKVGYLIDINNRYKRHHGFNVFIKNELTTWDEEELPNINCYIVGSDQIWNPKITKGFDALLFGLDEFQLSKPTISYAGSMESLSLDEVRKREFIDKLGNLKAIGVRESSLEEYITDNSNLTVQHVLDPTLLLHQKDWLTIAEKSKLRVEDKFVLVYENYTTPQTEAIAKSIANYYGVKVITIVAGASRHHAKEINATADPYDFVSLFQKAEFIITTSYHGLAFSLIFNKNFISLSVKDGVNNRATSLLNKIGLSEYMVNPDEFDIKDYNYIDYTKVNNRLNAERQVSASFLIANLERFCD